MLIPIQKEKKERLAQKLSKYFPIYDIRTLHQDIKMKNKIKQFIDANKDNKMPFAVEIETINRCNGECQFCPVNRYDDPRLYAKMDNELFLSIIHQLSILSYSGELCLYSNNEPFLDNRIIELCRIAREKLPNAALEISTNGTLLNLDRYKQIMNYLDRLIIDNYDTELHENIKEIHEYCSKDFNLNVRTRIVMRRNDQISSSRGGKSPNRHLMNGIKIKSMCTLPFRQLIIRPDGKVSLCCNDATGYYTLGDLKQQTILEIWNGELRKDILRNMINKGRQAFDLCSKCDNIT